MELEHFGIFLKQRREARGMTLADLSRATKIKECLLDRLESAELEALPAQVFVRGWVCAYAREVGLDQLEALRRYKQHLHWLEKTHAPVPVAPVEDASSTEEPAVDRRRFGVVMVVLLILVVATLTLSLLLRHGPSRGSGLSSLEATPEAASDLPSRPI